MDLGLSRRVAGFSDGARRYSAERNLESILLLATNDKSHFDSGVGANSRDR